MFKMLRGLFMPYGFLLSLLLTYAKLNAQPIIQFRSFDISNTSGEVLNLTTSELKRINNDAYTSLIQQQQKAFYSRYNLLDSTRRVRFMEDFKNTLDQSRNRYLRNEVIFTVNPKLIDDAGIDALRRNTNYTSSKYIDNFIVPALRAGFSEYALDQTKESIETLLTDKNRLDSIVNYSLAYLRNSGVALNAQTTLNLVRTNLARLFVIANESNKLLNDQIVTQLTAEVFKKIQNNVQSTIQGLNANQIRSTLENSYVRLYSEVKSKTEASINELGRFLTELSSNEAKVQESINSIYADWKNVDNKIKSIERDLLSVALSAEEKLKAQAEHARLVAQNFLKLEVVNKYLNHGAKALSLIQDFKSGVYDKIFSTEERNKFLNNLTSFDLPTITETVQGVAQGANFLARQFPNSKAVREVAKFVNYAVAAINIGTGIAELFSGNPMGVLSIVGGLKSLFGGAPQESPEMQMMRQMMDYMQKSFNAVFDHLEFIEKQLENLTTLVQDMYRDMIKSFQVISDQLNRIEARERVLDQRTRQILYRQFTNCDQLERNRINESKIDSTFLNKYNDYVSLYGSPSCPPCLTALFNSTIREALKDFSAISSTVAWDLSTIEVDTIYNPTKNLFRALYKDNPLDAIRALTLPVKTIAQSNKIFSEIVRMQKAGHISVDGMLNVYYDYNMLEKLTHLLITYSSFLEIGNEQFRPKNLQRYLSTPPAELRIKRNDLIDRLTAVLELINSSIVQQSLMAGNLLIEGTYQILLGVNPNNENVDLAIQVLKSNRLFAKNFASRLIFSSINSRIVDDRARYTYFTNLFYEAKANEQKRKELNDEFGSSFMQFVYNKEYNNLFLQISARGKQFEIAVPEPSFILSNEMVQSDALYSLIKAKEKIVTKLIDLSFISNFNSQNGITVNDLKYIFEPF